MIRVAVCQLFIFIMTFSQIAEGQLFVSEHYKPAENAKVFSVDGTQLLYPFAGGLNNCQFANIDLNLDGIADLLVFDRHGDRLLAFVVHPGQTPLLQFEPALTRNIPSIRQWIQCADYNGDGKADIFTYTTGGIKVFRNDSGNELKFTQVTFPFLLSKQGNTLTNILVTSADYPAIADVDNDSDLDVLTFWGLGSFVEWHRNFSRERYANSDSLVFEKSVSCWGNFAEGTESNLIKLDTCVASAENTKWPADSDPKHTGSTILVHDADCDGLPDLTIGDVDFSTLIHLHNGGTLQDAKMVWQANLFSETGHPVWLDSFPAAMLADVNNDGKKDLIVSPFEPSLVKSENLHSVDLYLNTGTDSCPEYVFSTDSFLQSEMFDRGSGSYPALLDFNGDGLTDIVVGNYGIKDTCKLSPITGLQCSFKSSLTLLLNEGTRTNPIFRIADTNLAHLDSLGLQSLIPALGDMDGDGDPDLVCGNSKGKFVYCENKSSGASADFRIIDPAWLGIDAGDFSAPQIMDIDGDGLPDLVSGKRDGKLSFYKNTGSAASPQFSLVSENFGGVSVTNPDLSNYGYSVPQLYKDNQNKIKLLTGSEFDNISLYDQVNENLSGNFRNRGRLADVNEGWRTGVAIGDLNGDTIADIVVGNYAGGINLYYGTVETPNGMTDKPAGISFLQIIPNPATDKIRLKMPDLSENEVCSVEIRNTDGKILWKTAATRLPMELAISFIPNGIYIVEIRTKRLTAFGKLVICR